MKIQQAVVIPMLKPATMELEVFLGKVADIGYRAVEIWHRDEHTERTLDIAARLGLRVVSMCGHKTGLNDPAAHDAAQSELRESINFAASHDIPNLICFSGQRRPDLTDERGAGFTADGLRRIAPHAAEKGVNLNLELLNTRIDHPGYQCDRTAWGVKVCQAVSHPRVKLLYDIYHMQIMEGDIIRTIGNNIGWIAHFHTAGVPGRHDLDAHQELNYAAIFNAIADTDYAGFVGHEFKPKGDVIESLRQAYAICYGSA